MASAVGSTKRSTGISNTCTLGTKTYIRLLFAVFHSPVEETIPLHKNGKLLVVKLFTMSAICSPAYIPPVDRRAVICPL
jgi:hypothetical protein